MILDKEQHRQLLLSFFSPEAKIAMPLALVNEFAELKAAITGAKVAEPEKE